MVETQQADFETIKDRTHNGSLYRTSCVGEAVARIENDPLGEEAQGIALALGIPPGEDVVRKLREVQQHEILVSSIMMRQEIGVDGPSIGAFFTHIWDESQENAQAAPTEGEDGKE